MSSDQEYSLFVHTTDDEIIPQQDFGGSDEIVEQFVRNNFKLNFEYDTSCRESLSYMIDTVNFLQTNLNEVSGRISIRINCSSWETLTEVNQTVLNLFLYNCLRINYVTFHGGMLQVNQGIPGYVVSSALYFLRSPRILSMILNKQIIGYESLIKNGILASSEPYSTEQIMNTLFLHFELNRMFNFYLYGLKNGPRNFLISSLLDGDIGCYTVGQCLCKYGITNFSKPHKQLRAYLEMCLDTYIKESKSGRTGL